MPSISTLAFASLAVAAIGVGGTGAGYALAKAGHGQPATVVKIVDGDTIDVSYEGAEHRVRLLNIDTPEMDGKQKDAECLAPEATRYLRNRLPIGAPVQLKWDRDHEDPYGRQLRGVFDTRGFINEDIVRHGLAVPMHIDPNDRYEDKIDEAFAEASAARRGLHDDEFPCTVAARTQRVDDAVAQDKQSVARKEALALQTLLDDPDSYAARLLPAASRGDLVAHLNSVINPKTPTRTKKSTTTKAPKKATTTKTPTKKATKTPTPSATKGSPRPTSSRPTQRPTTPPPVRTTPPPSRTQAPPPPAPSTTHSPPPAPAPRSTSTPAPPPPASTRPNNAAPCRSYAPGGKTFTYIDCDTRQPL